MRIYIQATFFEFWMCIVNGLKVPTKMIGGVLVPKKEEEWNEDDFKLLQLN